MTLSIANVVKVDIGVSATVSPTSTPPSIVPVGDKTVGEGGTLAFNVLGVLGVDPAGALVMTAETIPTGAMFVDTGSGIGQFTWGTANPRGTYVVTFKVSDTVQTTSETILITVVQATAEGWTGNTDCL